MKSTKFGNRYLKEGLSQWDEIWQFDLIEVVLLYIRAKIGEL